MDWEIWRSVSFLDSAPLDGVELLFKVRSKTYVELHFVCEDLSMIFEEGNRPGVTVSDEYIIYKIYLHEITYIIN